MRILSPYDADHFQLRLSKSRQRQSSQFATRMAAFANYVHSALNTKCIIAYREFEREPRRPAISLSRHR